MSYKRKEQKLIQSHQAFLIFISAPTTLVITDNGFERTGTGYHPQGETSGIFCANL